MKNNLVVKASAGTGKTFAIATRFIRLLVFGGRRVRPETILGLTFSRAAAQEIYEKILGRLRDAAASEAGAAREREVLTAGLDPARAEDRAELDAARTVDWSPRTFAGVLRRVLDAQGHDTIATLDSFIQRIVRAFPLETGFQRNLSVLDGYGEALATQNAVSALLSATDGDGALLAAFRAAQAGDAVRDGFPRLERAADDWRPFFAERPGSETWTAATMRRALGLEADLRPPDLSAVPATGRTGRNGQPLDLPDKVLARLRDVAAGKTDPGKLFETKAGECIRFFADRPGETAFADEKGKTTDFGAAGAAAVRAAVRHAAAAALDRKLETVAANLALAGEIARRRDAAALRKGLLAFGDFTGRLAATETSERRLDLRNLQFRLDSEFDHWALDEFQDTSMAQWDCLKPLVEQAVEQAASGEARSVLAVGDLKQSIYGWRGGDDRPFVDLERIVAANGGAAESIGKSWRYGKETAGFVNAVFSPENVRAAAGGACAGAVDKWERECWPDGGHEADATGDFVEIVGVERDDGAAADDDGGGEGGPGAAMRVLAPALCRCVAGLWTQHEAQRREAERSGRPFRPDTVGVLVRNNADGLYLAERLRKTATEDGAPIPVVWEGESGVLDSPVVRAVLALLQLAWHPGDDFSWAVANAVFPVREAVFPDKTTRAEVSAAVSASLSRLGLARTLRAVADALKAKTGLDPRSGMRLERLVREGVRFESRPDADGGVDAFRAYLETVSDRETAASPGVVRILTIHRSKGLTLDHVVVPVPETARSGGLLEPRGRTRLAGDGWVFDSLSGDLARLNDKTRAAWEAAADDHLLEELRTWYVAFTRAVKSTRVFVVRDDARTVGFRDLLLAPFAGEEPRETDCGTVLHAAGTQPPFTTEPKDAGGPAAPRPEPWSHSVPRETFERETPSDAAAAGGGTGFRPNVADLLAEDGARGGALRRGIEEHAAFAAIEWIDPDAPKDERERRILDCGGAWPDAFRRTPGATVWRERNYELLRGGVWESGQFDRVVFRGEGAARTAEIYDFKTNAKGERETVRHFEDRLRAAYAAQMSAYRAALARLTGIPETAITTTLLLTATGTSVEA